MSIEIKSADEIKSYIISELAKNSKLARLTNFNRFGKVRTIIETISLAIYQFIMKIAEPLWRSIFPQFAEKQDLIYHLGTEGLVWKNATKAQFDVRIGSSEQPTSRVDIPVRLEVGTAEAVSFLTSSTSFIDDSTPADVDGKYTTIVRVTAILAGADGNVPAGSIVEVNSDHDKIDFVKNDSVAVVPGEDEETIEEARERYFADTADFGRGTKSWFEQEAESLPTVQKAICIPRMNGRGTVGIVVFGQAGDLTEQQLADVETHFNTEEMDPAGAWHVSAVNATKKIGPNEFTVYWEEAEPSDAELYDAYVNSYDGIDLSEDIIPQLISEYIRAAVDTVKYTICDSHNSPIPVGSSELARPAETVTWNKVQYVDQ